MELQGQQVIMAPIEKVWEGLNDIEILAKVIPGCEEILRLSENELSARVMLKIGPVRARFSGKIELRDIIPQTSCSMVFEGSGGAAGFAKGTAVVQLSQVDGMTTILYTTHANIGGKLGQIGGRLIDASAKKIADEFFMKFNEVVGSPVDHDSHHSLTEYKEKPTTPYMTGERSTEPVLNNSDGDEEISTTIAAVKITESTRILWFSMGVASTALGVILYSYFLK
ncbi:MAG: carbon monoxide dehydrogenase subunit G [Betaproteobacteria bacterium]|jgi:carbon monoxide dehydrogenase subunit G